MPIVVPRFEEVVTFATTADLNVTVGSEEGWAALVSFNIAGLAVDKSAINDLYYIQEFVGDTNIPGDIRRLRASTQELMRRMGQPVVVKHMFTDYDVKLGIAQTSPVLDPTYGQTRNWDPYSYGTGYCSVQTSTNEWISPNGGRIITADIQPAANYAPAPKYRGYGPGYLTYLIEPDVPMDIFKLSSAGALTKIQTQTVVSGWFPEINDNDLVINVELDHQGNVKDAKERYQAKKTQPISIRGLDRKGRQEYSADHGNRFVVNQNFEMNAIPETSVLYQVEIDR